MSVTSSTIPDITNSVPSKELKVYSLAGPVYSKVGAATTVDAQRSWTFAPLERAQNVLRPTRTCDLNIKADEVFASTCVAAFCFALHS